MRTPFIRVKRRENAVCKRGFQVHSWVEECSVARITVTIFIWTVTTALWDRHNPPPSVCSSRMARFITSRRKATEKIFLQWILSSKKKKNKPQRKPLINFKGRGASFDKRGIFFICGSDDSFGEAPWFTLYEVQKRARISTQSSPVRMGNGV